MYGGSEVSWFFILRLRVYFYLGSSFIVLSYGFVFLLIVVCFYKGGCGIMYMWMGECFFFFFNNDLSMYNIYFFIYILERFG